MKVFCLTGFVAVAIAQDYIDYTSYDADGNPVYSLDDKEVTGFGIEEDTPENGDPDFMPIDGQRQQPVTKPQQGGRNYNNNNNNNNQPDNETSPIKCWHCEADSFDLCGQTGYEESCRPNEVNILI